jgi:hypothetical protein
MTKARDLANASTALSAVSATELGYVDGVTSAIQTQMDTKLATATAATTYVANSLADAKGDIFVATADNTVTRLPVGNSGEQIVADSSQTRGLRYQVPVNANPFLNSAMQVWQRGTSFALAASTSTYTADRWKCRRNATGATISRQATNDTTNLPFIQYALRAQRDSGNATTDLIQVTQSFENVNSIPYAGKTLTISFYARAGANYSASSNGLVINLRSGTSNDGDIIVNTFGNVIANQTATLTTTWQRFSYTGTMVATDTQIGLQVYSVPTCTAGANDWFEITGIQLEVGSVATPFKTYAATIQGELAACQRYYYQPSSTITAIVSWYQTTKILIPIKLPVTMRTNASYTAGTGTVFYNSASQSVTSLTLDSSSVDAEGISGTTTAQTVGWAGYLILNTDNKWSAEL